MKRPSSSTTIRRMASSPKKTTPPFIDIGANLLDEMYQGIYRGKERHDKDLERVLQRAFDQNVQTIIITCGTLTEARKGIEMAKTNDHLFCTVGVHPTRCSSEFGTTQEEWDEYLIHLEGIIQNDCVQGGGGCNVVAVGELGLDYARLHFCDIETQKRGFIEQLKLAKKVNLPLFLHNRETGTDLLDILKEHYFDIVQGVDNDEILKEKIHARAGGVVHSFDDTLELAQQFMELGLYIGLNGCSLRTDANLQVAKDIPLDKLMLETDCPWCDIRATHAGYNHVQTKFPTKSEKKYDSDCCVKGRYEPMHIIQVAEVIAGVKGISVEEVATASRNNAHKLFGKLTKEFI